MARTKPTWKLGDPIPEDHEEKNTATPQDDAAARDRAYRKNRKGGHRVRKNKSLKSEPMEKHEEKDATTPQDDAAARDRVYSRNQKHKHRVRMNKSLRSEPHGIKMGYMRRWMMNEMRREDKGGISQQAWYALSKWSREPENGGKITLEPDAEAAKDRFMAEWDAATVQQGKNNRLENWWARVPSYAERTGEPRPDRCFKKLMNEETKGMELMMRGDGGCDNAIVIDDSDDDDDDDDDDGSGEKEMAMVGDVESAVHGGISGQMVLRGPRPSSVGGDGGRRLSSLMEEPHEHFGFEESLLEGLQSVEADDM
ncbi:MAG: hypothetical protein Q9168_002240 [Polycauliona sp. 1 TL-2023]